MKKSTAQTAIDIIDEQQNVDHRKFRFLGVDLHSVSGFVRFMILCGGVFFFYLLYGYYQELIFNINGFKPFGWYLTLVQFALYTLFGFAETRLSHDRQRRIPIRAYLTLAFLTVATMGLSNATLGYLNYPIQVIFKCCKLVPVLIGGILIQGKRYGAIDVLSCLCMSIGLIFFSLADSSVSPSFSLYGLLLISLALCADAVIGNVQEKTMKLYGASNAEVVLYSYAIGFVYIFAVQLLTNQLWEPLSFCIKNPVVYLYIFLFSITGYLGINIVLTLVKVYGALTAVTVTTCRKAISIILSFLLFAKPFTYHYVWSGLMVVLGIYLNIYSKNQSAWNAWFKQVFRNRLQTLSRTQFLAWLERTCLGRHRFVYPHSLQRIV